MDMRSHRTTILPQRDYSSRIRHAWPSDWKSESEWRQPSGAAIAGFAALAVVVAAGVYFGPDFIRYLKIRRM